MKNIILILLVFGCIGANGQQIHVKYLYVRSPAVTIYENLYINENKNVISIQDSLRNKGDNLNGLSQNTFVSDAYYYISDMDKVDDRDFLFTEELDSQRFFVYDSNIKMNDWTIHEKERKKIAGYICIKATTIFRGTELVAYYAPDLKYSAGPYKFFGLPGLILEIKVKDRPYLMWKADSVDLDSKKEVVYKPKFSKHHNIGIRDYVEKRDQKIKNFNTEARRNLPEGTEVKSMVPNFRFGVEAKYEWE